MKRLNHHPSVHPKNVASHTGADREVAEELLHNIAQAEAVPDLSPQFSWVLCRIARELSTARRRKTALRSSGIKGGYEQ